VPSLSVSDGVPPDWRELDVAFSHEVLYLIEDLGAHAREIFAALQLGGIYYAVLGVHAASQMMVQWHSDNARRLGLPRLRDLDDVVAAFVSAGFQASAARLAIDFIPAADQGHHGQGALLDWLDYYYDHKPLLRFRRPQSRGATAASPRTWVTPARLPKGSPRERFRGSSEVM
jgi:hypothetical protein